MVVSVSTASLRDLPKLALGDWDNVSCCEDVVVVLVVLLIAGSIVADVGCGKASGMPMELNAVIRTRTKER